MKIEMKLSQRTEMINKWGKGSKKGVHVQHKIQTCKNKWEEKKSMISMAQDKP